MVKTFCLVMALGLVWVPTQGWGRSSVGGAFRMDLCQGKHASVSGSYVAVVCEDGQLAILDGIGSAGERIRKLRLDRKLIRVFAFGAVAYAVAEDNLTVYEIDLASLGLNETYRNVLPVGDGQTIVFSPGWAAKAVSTYQIHFENFVSGSRLGPYRVADVPGYNPLGFDYSEGIFYQAAGYPGQVTRVSIPDGDHRELRPRNDVRDVKVLGGEVYFLDYHGSVWSRPDWQTGASLRVFDGGSSFATQLGKFGSELFVFHEGGIRLLAGQASLSELSLPGEVDPGSFVAGVTDTRRFVFLVPSRGVWISDVLRR